MSKLILQHKVLIFVSVTVFVALLIAGSTFYMYNVQAALWKQSVTDAVEITSQGAHAFEIFLRKDGELLHNLAANMATYSSEDETRIEDKLFRFESTDETYLVIDLDKKIAHLSAIYNHDIPISDDTAQLYRSMPERGIREPYYDEYTGQKVISYYERFKFTDGAEAVALKTELVAEISKEFSLSFFNDEGFSYIVNSEGDVIVRSRNKNSNHTMQNLFDFIGSREPDKQKIEDFRQNMREGKTGATQLTTNNGDRVFAYNCLEDTDGWYVVSSIPTDAVTRHTDSIMKTSQMMFFITVIGFVGLAIVFLLIRANRRSIMQKDAEIKYRDKMFDLISRNTNDIFFMFDADENLGLNYISPNVERVLGVAPELAQDELSALGEAEYLNGEDISREDLMGLEVGKSLTREAKRVNIQTNEALWTMETVYRVSMSEGHKRDEKFISVISDRTYEHKSKAALEEALAVAEAANRSKSAFLSNMSHDIRTPMNAIVGFATLLQRDAEKADAVREYTKKIVVSSQHLLGLINDVLDMSKIESGKTTLNIADFSLSDTIGSISSMIRPQAAAKNQEFIVKAVGVLSEHLLGDTLRISQVLINILSNAVKYTDIGGRIEFTIEEVPIKNKRYAHLRFVVKDNGMGMTDEYIKTIFDPFTRAENSTTNAIQGTGLGMAITKNLIDLMGGSIEVESKLGRGSTFTVDLELRVQQTHEDEDFWKNNGINKMLIADDDRDTCVNVLNAMDSTGIELKYALGGLAAVEKAREAHEKGEGFDLYLLDLKMPDLNGIEAARKIREFVKDAPIMVLTSYDWDEVKDEAYEAGINAFLPKPFFLSSFRQTIENLRGGRTNTDNHPESASGSEDILRGKSFLAAEDNELNAEILTELLKMCDAKVDIAPNGKECVRMFEASEEGKYDAVLMDVQMPVMNGYEATKLIRSGSHPSAKTIPIIAMTANAFDDDRQNAFSAGMNAHVSKPVDMGQLTAVLTDIFGAENE